jgi:deoxyribonuclease-4
MIIGSHVSFSGKQLLSSALEAISYNANAFMFYTGAPQNTVRSKINAEHTSQALEVMKEHNIDIKNVICHAPYIINLANNKDESKYEFSKNFLKGEITRCHELGVKYIVLHPGSSVGIDRLTALDNIANALKQVLEGDEDITILLETMAGKGTELGINIDELKYIIKSVNNDKLGVCLDTCHLNDSGVDINNFEIYLNIFDREIGLDKVHCIHINDSKNPLGARKDRHENIGFGTIGFDAISKVCNIERLKDVPKILETPYINGKAPYKEEIEELRNNKFNPNLKELF